MKKFLLIFLALFLVSCSGDETNISGLSTIEKDGYSISIPSNWEIINDKSKLPNTNYADIDLVAVSPNVEKNFSNNILILSNDIETLTSSKDYSILNNVGSREDFLEYNEIDSKNVTFASGNESLMYIFNAKYNLDTPKLKFIQSAVVCNKTKGYFFTIALLDSVDDTSKYEDLITSFKCK